jgi:hypothetical protein
VQAWGKICAWPDSPSFLAFTAFAPGRTPPPYPNHLKRTHTPEEDHGDETRPD